MGCIKGQRRARNESTSHSTYRLFIPVTLNVSYVQDRVGVSRPQTQRLVDNVVHLHVASSTGRTHQKPNKDDTQWKM